MPFPDSEAPVSVEIAPGADPSDQSTWSWVDVTSYVRTESGITITYGRSDEASQADPSTCALTLDNSDGRFSPRNITGEYFGKLARNTPLRVRWRLDSDVFGTNVTGGWGSTDDLETSWTTGGSGGTVDSADFSVSSGVAKHSVEAAGASRLCWLDIPALDAEVLTTVNVPISNVTGGDLAAGIMLRVQDENNYYLAKLAMKTDETLELSVDVVEDGVSTNLDSAVPIETQSASTNLSLRARTVGNWIQVRVWDADNETEALEWDLTAKSAKYSSAGGVGILSSVGTGNTNTKPVVFSYADFTVMTDRFVGYVQEWPSRWNKAVTEATVQIEAAGVLRRLSQPGRQTPSSLRRRITRLAPAAYWPLEDGDGTTKAGSASDPGLPMVVNGFSFGADSDLPGALALPTMGAGSNYRGRVSSGWDGSNGGWQVELALKMDQAASKNNLVYVETTGKVRRWEVSISGTNWTVRGVDEDETQLVNSTFAATDFLGSWNDVLLYATENGSTVTWGLVWYPLDGTSHSTFGTFTGTVGAVRQVYLLTRGSGAETVSVGHVAVFDATSGTTRFADAMSGYKGESATVRGSRVCSAESVLWLDEGDPDLGGTDTSDLGPEPQGDLVTVLRDIEAADGGILAELDGGIYYVPRVALYNQPVTMALDIDDGDLDTPPEPTDDDQILVNDVTASRPGGSFVRVVNDASVAKEGRYSRDVTANVKTDDDLADVAGWVVHVGSVDEMRWPVISLRLDARTSILPAWQAMRIGSRFTVDHTLDQIAGVSIDLLAVGWTEVIAPFSYTVEVNAVPASPWMVGELGDAVLGRLDTDGCTLVDDVTATDTSLVVETTNTLSPGWTTDPDEMPFDLKLGGEVVTVTAVEDTPLNGNPFFETDVSGWVMSSGDTIERSAAQSHEGTHSALLTPDGSGALTCSVFNSAAPTAGAGERYVGSVWVYSPNGYSQVEVGLVWINASNSVISVTFGPLLPVASATWTNLSVISEPPAGAAKVGLRIAMLGTPTSSDTLYIDEAIVSSNQQALTVTRSVNGVTKAHDAGTDIALAQPLILAR